MKYFTQFGRVQKLWIKDGANFGFVVFEDDAGTVAALSFPSHVFQGKEIEVKLPGALPTQVFIAGLQDDTNETKVKARLERFGTVVNWQRKVHDGRLASFAFVTYRSQEEVRRALDAKEVILNGQSLPIRLPYSHRMKLMKEMNYSNFEENEYNNPVI